ncbi:MAG: hypothetical protein AAB726_01460 [Patescibacteria group bacterium]
MNITNKYTVVFAPFAERHFIKTFAKKYRKAWDLTRLFLEDEFRFFDVLFSKSIAETITDSREIKICKTEFKIAGTKESRHGSGNRCIVAIHKNTRVANVLLVYYKGDLNGKNETVSWKGLVKENYPEYFSVL